MKSIDFEILHTAYIQCAQDVIRYDLVGETNQDESLALFRGVDMLYRKFMELYEGIVGDVEDDG